MKPDPSTGSEMADSVAEEAPGIDALNDDIVANYLSQHPDFFDKQKELLLSLSIHHESGDAISLLERQVTLFRERNKELNDNINSFILNAEDNDALFEKTRIIILAILRSNTLSELSEAVSHNMKLEFAALDSALIFIAEKDSADGLFIKSRAEAIAALGELYEKKRTLCTSISKEQCDFLFPEVQGKIVSAAIIPVHIAHAEIQQHNKGVPGQPLLVIGSDQPDHFNSTLDTLFLDFIGEVMACHIGRLLNLSRTD